MSGTTAATRRSLTQKADCRNATLSRYCAGFPPFAEHRLEHVRVAGQIRHQLRVFAVLMFHWAEPMALRGPLCRQERCFQPGAPLPPLLPRRLLLTVLSAAEQFISLRMAQSGGFRAHARSPSLVHAGIQRRSAPRSRTTWARTG